MPSLKDPRKGKIAILPHIANDVLGTPNRFIARVSKGFGAGIRHGERSGLAAEPATRIVAVAVDHVDFDAAVEEVGDGVEGAGAHDVGCAFKGFEDGGRCGGEVDGDAEGRENPGLVEVAVHVCSR